MKIKSFVFAHFVKFPEEVLADINQALYTLIEICRRRIDEDDISSIIEDDLEQLENCIH